jgi:hypothetical protein
MTTAESERITSLLRNAIRLSNCTYRDVERQLGWRVGTITRLMRGGLGLKVEHLLSILRVIQFSPARFFAAAFPPLAGANPLEDRLCRMLEQMHGESPLAGPIAGSPPLPALAAAATPATASSGRDATRQDEIDEMVRTSLRKLIGTPEAADKPTP